ncbi:MAG: GSU2403 family nucleotidyltransferase fold protein [bacterium]
MEKKKYDLCLELLRRLKHEGVLDRLVLVGSWCTLLYQEYFSENSHVPALRTRDIEFLVPIPPKFPRKIDLPELLKDLGFVVDHKGSEGFIQLFHPDLILEFLAPSRGRERQEPYPVPDLGINAHPLRFMDVLAENTIAMKLEGISVKVPHPAHFALHKLLIAGRRKNPEKAPKDRAQAVGILKSLRATGEMDVARTLFAKFPASWQQTIRAELTALGEQTLMNSGSI